LDVPVPVVVDDVVDDVVVTLAVICWL